MPPSPPAGSQSWTGQRAHGSPGAWHCVCCVQTPPGSLHLVRARCPRPVPPAGRAGPGCVAGRSKSIPAPACTAQRLGRRSPDPGGHDRRVGGGSACQQHGAGRDRKGADESDARPRHALERIPGTAQAMMNEGVGTCWWLLLAAGLMVCKGRTTAVGCSPKRGLFSQQEV